MDDRVFQYISVIRFHELLRSNCSLLCGDFCRPDTRHIFVDIGLGFHVEFTWQEALQFISVREARLARYVSSNV